MRKRRSKLGRVHGYGKRPKPQEFTDAMPYKPAVAVTGENITEDDWEEILRSDWEEAMQEEHGDWRPTAGDEVINCRGHQLKIAHVDPHDSDCVTLEDGSTCSLLHCCERPLVEPSEEGSQLEETAPDERSHPHKPQYCYRCGTLLENSPDCPLCEFPAR